MKKNFILLLSLILILSISFSGCGMLIDRGTDENDTNASNKDDTTPSDTSDDPIVLPPEPAYIRVDENGNENEQGEYVLMGTYPQSEVKDTELKNALTALSGALPAAEASGAWISYEYYIEYNNTNAFMWYQDVDHDGERYRGVYFIKYRPYYTSYMDQEGLTYQDDNGYFTEEIYWFKYEPIKWRILSEKDGKAMLFSEMILDSQEYYYRSWSDSSIENEDEDIKQTASSNNYEYSGMRQWLNTDFYNIAFNDTEKEAVEITLVDNSAATTSSSNNIYACNDTEDKVFLLSYREVLNSEYGFETSYSGYDIYREKITTSYARCQGAYTGLDDTGRWWLRSPGNYGDTGVRTVSIEGTADDYRNVYSTDCGICPAMWITLA